MDTTNTPITVSEIPPRRLSTGLSFLLRTRDQNNPEVLASSHERSRNNSITSTQSNKSKSFSQSILDNWLVSTSAQRSFDYEEPQDNFPPWALEQPPAEITDVLHGSRQSDATLERNFSQEDELALSDKDKSPKLYLKDEYSIITRTRDDNELDEEAFITATSTSLSPIGPSTNNLSVPITGGDSQDTVAYNTNDSDSQDTVLYKADTDSQDTVPYNVYSDSEDSMSHNVNDPHDTLQVHRSTYHLGAHDHLDSREAHDILDGVLEVPLLDDSNALLRDDHNDALSDSSIPFVISPPTILDPLGLSQLSNDPSEPLPPSISSQSSSQLINDLTESLSPGRHNTLEDKKEEDKDPLDDQFDDITDEDMIAIVELETIAMSQSSSSKQSQKRPSSPIPTHAQDSPERPEKKQLKSSFGSKPAPIDNYFFHSSSSLNSNKDLDKDIGRSTLTPSFAVSSSLEKAEKSEKSDTVKPKPHVPKRRPRLGLSKVKSKNI